MTDLLHRDRSMASPHASPVPDKVRRCLLTFSAGAAGAAIATTALAARSALARPVESEVEPHDFRSRGYQETAHVRSYYTTTRI